MKKTKSFFLIISLVPFFVSCNGKNPSGQNDQVGSEFGRKERVIPGPHAWDGSYTELVVEWQGICIGVRSAAVDNEFFLQISPIRQSPGDTLLLDPQMLWGG